MIIVGAGFAGLYMLHKARQAGFSTRVFEVGYDVGGTWFWNRYPGARCDVESFDYCYSFDEALQQEWTWTERYPAQPEILSYIQWVAEWLNLRPDITFNTRVESAEFDEAADNWIVHTDTGEKVRARWFILGTGCLSSAKAPDITGLADFKGKVLHTADWPDEEVDLSDRRVGVIGTGSSGIQVIPVLAETAGHLTVFQRTAAFSIPARNRDLKPDEIEAFKKTYSEHRAKTRQTPTGVLFRQTGKAAMEVDEAEREAAYEEQWVKGGADFPGTFTDLRHDMEANKTAADFVRGKIRDIVEDAETADSLCPKDVPLGAKRICLDTGYYQTFNRENVSLADLRKDPLLRIKEDGVATENAFYPIDVLVLATGFDAITGSIMKIDIKGANGKKLEDAWHAGPKTYLGLMSADFPNLFMITGPGSPSVLTNMVAAIEQHVDWITDCLIKMREEDQSRIEPQPASVEKWVAGINKVAASTLYMEANSWYLGANVPGKPRVFMPYLMGLNRYREICDSVAENDYEGFIIS